MPSTFRLPQSLLGEVDRVAAERRVSRSVVVREAISAFVSSPGPATTGQIIDRLVTWKGSGRGDLAKNGERLLREKFHGRRRPR